LERAEVVIFNGVDEVELNITDVERLYESHVLMELLKGLLNTTNRWGEDKANSTSDSPGQNSEQ